MKRSIFTILITALLLTGLMVSCNSDVSVEQPISGELVAISFDNGGSKGLTASLEAFNKGDYYWAYAAKKADSSNLISGQTANYGQTDEDRVWVKTDGNNPVPGLGAEGTSGYEAYKVPGFSQGYWNFKLYAYKKVVGDNPATTDVVETEYYVLVYQGETLNALLKSDSVNAQGSHLVSVTVNPVQSEGNGTMVFLTNQTHAAADRISMNTVNSATYGTDYTVKVLSILSIEDFPVEYVDAAGAKIHEATDSQDGKYSLPAGSYKVTVSFTDAGNTVNYARGTIVATVYSNLTTTIGGDLTEAMTYAEFEGTLNPDLETVTVSSDAIEYNELESTTQVSFSSTGTAKAVTATTTKAVTNQIIQEIVATNGTNLNEYHQSLVLTLSVETVEATATTATYEIGMTAELTSTKISDQSFTTTTSDVSNVENYVTIELQLQPGLTIVSVLHSGELMTESPTLDTTADTGSGIFKYNSSTGVLTIMTKSFSPFDISYTSPSEADYVAQVGNLKFLTLSDAIAKAASNSTVTLLKSITLSDTVDFNVQGGILNLAGYSITGDVTASANGAIIKNGSISGTLTAGGNSALIKDLTVTGKISVGGTGAVLENCTVTGTGDYVVEVTAGNATIKSGTYKAADNGKILNGNILVEDGNFKGTLTESTSSVSLVGGVYEQNVGAYVADGYECAKVSEGVYKVRKIVEAVNVNTGVEYYFLQDAIDAASASDTIKLLRNNIDINTPVVVPSTASITLDLDGNTITVRVKDGISNEGTLIIDGTDDSSRIVATDIDGLVNNKAGGVMTLNGGTYVLNHASTTDLCKKYYVVYNNGSSLTLNGATINTARGGIRTTAGDFVVKTATIDVNVGEGLNEDIWVRGIYVSDSSNSAVIKDGTYTYYGRTDGALIRVADGRSISVEGGSFTVSKYDGAEEYAKAMTSEETGSNYKITGGTWKGDIGRDGDNAISGGRFVDGKFYVNSGSSLNITGGTFCSAVNIYSTLGNYVDLTKYYIDSSVEGEKTVLPYTPENSDVSITDGTTTLYMPLGVFRDSVNNGTSYEGFTVKLLRNVNLEGVSWTPIGTVDNPFRGTFDGNGKTIDNLSNHGFTSSTIDGTYNSGSSNAFALFGYLRGNVTIKDLTVYVYASDAKGKGYAGIVGLLKNDYETKTATADTICNLTLDNLKVYGEIIGEDKVAGVIAQVPNYGYTQSDYSSTTTINKCENYATIKGERAGGILSVNSGAESGHTTITYCANHGTLTVPANGTYSVAAGIIAQTNTSNQNYYTVANCSNDGTISATIAYGLTANVFLHNPWTETYTPGTSIGGIDNVITDPAKFMELYYSFSGTAISPVRWKEVEYIAGNNITESNVDHTGILAGIAYDVGETFVAQYDYTVGERVFTYRFKDMEEALSRFNKGANYSNLTLHADAEWKSDYTREGDGPGYYSINLNSHELTVKAPIHKLDSNNNGLQKPVEIKNGTIKYDGSFTGYLFEDVERQGSISFEKVVLDSSVPEEIISIFPSTGGNDTIGISFDNQSSGFFGKKIRCMSPGTGGGDLLVLNTESIPMNDGRWVPDGTSGQTVLTIESNEQVSIDGQPAITLKAFRDSVNDGNSYEYSVVTLLCDVTTASDWTPIGNADNNPFKGVFDGQNHTVTMTFNNDSSSEIALFGVVDGGTIKNLTVDGSINALEKAAGVMYKIQNGSVLNVTNNTEITVKKNKAGGIVCNSYYSNLFDNCKNTGTITISEAPNDQTNNVCGGIVAYIGNLNDSNDQSFTGCVNNGDIVIANNNGFGAGIVGYASGGNTQTGTIAFDNCINCGQAAYGLLAYVHASSSTQTVSMDTCYDLTGKSLCYCHSETPAIDAFSITGPLYVIANTDKVIECSHTHAPSLSISETESFEYGGICYSVDKYVIQN